MLKYSILIAITLISCSGHRTGNPHIIINSRFGDIEVELFPAKAPKTVAAFLSYIDSGYYHNSSFYRVLINEGASPDLNTGIIQGGIWQTDPVKKMQQKGIEHETTKQTGLSHTDGTVSLARTTPGSGNTEFFICIGDQSNLDYARQGNGDGQGYAAFGKVLKGMDVVRKIQGQQSGNEHFDEKIEISDIKRL